MSAAAAQGGYNKL